MPTSNYTRCPLCHSVGTPFWRAASVWKCSSCKLLFRYPVLSCPELAELYNKSWQAPDEHTNETGGTDLDLARIYARKLADSLDIKDFEGLKILDFGAGRGAICSALSELGANVYAVEPFGFEYLVKQGFTTFRSLDEIPQGFTFDGIISIDVIEHLPYPWHEFAQLRELLAFSGWLYVTTANSSGLNATIFGSRWRELHKTGHLILFSPSNIEFLLKKCGFSKYRRLKWFIEYAKNPIRRLLHSALQTLNLDGELRYIAWKL